MSLGIYRREYSFGYNIREVGKVGRRSDSKIRYFSFAIAIVISRCRRKGTLVIIYKLSNSLVRKFMLQIEALPRCI